MPWANGLGTTSVVARRPDDERWVWRLSLADVTTDGPFSSLPGIDRTIVVASGDGMELTVDDSPPVRLTIGSPPFSFDGGAAVMCRLIDGPVVDLNLMVRRGNAGSLDVRRIASGDHFDLDVVACVILSGAIAVGPDVLARFDALVEPDAGTHLIAVDDTRLALVTVATSAVPGD